MDQQTTTQRIIFQGDFTKDQKELYKDSIYKLSIIPGVNVNYAIFVDDSVIINVVYNDDLFAELAEKFQCIVKEKDVLVSLSFKELVQFLSDWLL